jgi:hypothetical protein
MKINFTKFDKILFHEKIFLGISLDFLFSPY